MTFNGVGFDTDGFIIKYEWDFDGDGVYEWNNTSSGIAKYSYSTAGVYYAKLRVTDNDGGTDTDVCEVFVTAKADEGDDGPGFGSMVALSVLCLLALFWRRKRIVD